MKVFYLAVFLFVLTIISNCRHGHNNETKISSNGSDESHNEGKNCMTCHRLGGDGEGWFVVAGTVYDSLSNSPSANGIVQLFTGPGGTGDIKATVQVDAKGNFYTTQKIDFGFGLFPVVKSQNGSVHYMGTAITSAACNSCHGVSTPRIYVK